MVKISPALRAVIPSSRLSAEWLAVLPILAGALVALALLPACFGVAAAADLKVAVNKGDRPFGYIDDAGALTGFNIDLARALCQRIKAECQLEPVAFADFLPGVASGRFDFAVANMLRTPEREKLVDFSDRVWRSSSTFVARRSVIADVSPAALAGKTIAVQAGANQERFVREVYGAQSTILTFAGNEQRNAALVTGAADVMLGSIAASFLFLSSPDGGAYDIIGAPLYDRGLGGDVAIPVTKGKDALRLRINAALAELLRDGTFTRINNKYFPVSLY